MKGLLDVVKPTLIGQNNLNESRILQANPLTTGIIVDYRHTLNLPVHEIRLSKLKSIIIVYILCVLQ
jgi:hypothetical protein